jgi:hypothetical protein
MKDLVFACMLDDGEGESDALRLARSIRTFGGEYCFNPIWMLSRRSEDDLSEATRQALFSSGARLVTFDLEPAGTLFPFVEFSTAAALAEGLAQGEARYLAMLACDTLVLQTPSPFILSAGKSFGGCPVHLKLLGSRFDEPVDDFWSLIYRNCQVDMERIFSMQTIVDEQPVRAYFNAGLLVVRPERGLLRSWQADFERVRSLPEFGPFYQQSELYPIFMHQVVLAGSLLSSLKPDEVQQFPFEVNYPLHLHEKVSEKRRPTSFDQLITCRYEDYAETFSNPKVQEMLRPHATLQNWLESPNV